MAMIVGHSQTKYLESSTLCPVFPYPGFKVKDFMRGHLEFYKQLCQKSTGYRHVYPLHKGIHKPLAGAFPVFLLLGWSWDSIKKEVDSQGGIKKSKTSEKDAHTILLETADRLYYEDKKEELYKLLEKHKDENDDEILWRLARAAVDKGKNTNKEVQKPSCYEGLKYIKRALAINQNNWAVHKSAVMLNPNDAFSFHSLGCWCYAIANLNWYERLFAAAFYTNHPTSTFEEALHWFLLAEKNYPDFSAMNLCMLSMTYLQLGDTTSAIHYFQRCVELPVPYGTPVDKRVYVEMRLLFKTMQQLERNKKKHR